MSFFEYKSLKIAYLHTLPSDPEYKTSENAPQTVLFLHGWGPNKSTFEENIRAIEHTHSVYAIDFPGFGESDEPDTPWNLDAYTDMVVDFMSRMNITEPVVIGHSFGGRVAIKLANRVKLSKLILTNSAGIKPKRRLSYYLKVYGFKSVRTLNRFPIFHFLLNEPVKAYQEKYSSADYKQASDTMKKVLSKVVNEDLTHLLPHIDVPTLLIWGDLDTATPLEDAKLMESRIPDSGLVVFEGAGHFAYLEQPLRFNTILKTFIGE